MTYIELKGRVAMRCNICGVSEDQIENNVCRQCGNTYCAMEDWMWVDKRVFDCAKRLELLNYRIGKNPAFSAAYIREKLTAFSASKLKKVPQYLRDAVSCDGMTFASLEDFSIGVALRVCREGEYKIFPLGSLVYRSDGLKYGRAKTYLTPALCKDALLGTHFEQTYCTVSLD